MGNDTPTTAQPGNILIVDDTPANLDLLAGMLKSKGYVVRPVPNGKLALQAAEMLPPDVIMLDINMPDLDGFEVCRRLKANEKLRHIPVIFISALTETLDKVKAFAVGGVDYVTKPFQFEEVEARLETHLSLRRYQVQVETWTLQLASKVREQTYEIGKRNDALTVLVEKAQRNLDNTLVVFSNLMELRHPKMRGHACNVAEVSEKVAAAIGLSATSAIRNAGLLHDIGKIGFSDALLQKAPHSLLANELEAYRLHPIRGQATLDTIEDLRDASLLIRSHHEHYDGSGFPDGLSRDGIPLGSKIIAMADYLDWSIHASMDEEDPILAGFNKLKSELWKKLDPDLYGMFEGPAKEYYSRIIPKKGEIVVETALWALTPGMVLGKDIFSSTGILLIRRGSLLNERNIQSLHRISAYDPLVNGVYISM